MNTWSKDAVPTLPPLTVTGRIIGGVRLGVLILATLIGVVLFQLGRAVSSLLGPPASFHFWIARKWSGLCLWLAGLRLVVHGTPIPRGALVANHSSWIDILALRAVTLIYFVSKAEVANWPGVGFITRITGTVFIERRRTAVKQQEATLRARMAQDQLLCLFPEGTSTDGLRVLPYKSSLFSAFFSEGHGAHIMIQPVSVRYRTGRGRDLPEDLYGWWGTMGFETHIWDVLTRSFGGRVDVVFHRPVLADDFPDRKALADECNRRTRAGFETLKPEGALPGHAPS